MTPDFVEVRLLDGLVTDSVVGVDVLVAASLRFLPRRGLEVGVTLLAVRPGVGMLSGTGALLLNGI